MNAFLANKVGSGFDIAASIYGSQLYRRFSNTDILRDRLVPFLNDLFESQNKGVVKIVEEKMAEFQSMLREFINGFDY